MRPNMRAENENWGDTVRNHLFDQRRAVMVHWLILLNVVIFILGFFFQVDIPRKIGRASCRERV